MKRMLTVLLMVSMLLSLAACGREEAKEIIPVPETNANLKETDTLEIVMPSEDPTSMGNFTWMENMRSFFAEFYPDVEMKIQYVPAEEYGTVVAAAMMAGSGPDIIFPQQMQNSDLYKMMDSGALLNLDQVIKQDEQFHEEDYLDGVLEGARYKGGLYMMPLSIKTTYLTGSQEQNGRSGITESATDSIFTLLEEAARITRARKEDGDTEYRGMISSFLWKDDQQFRGTEWESEIVPETTHFFDIDIPLVNYETKEVLLDEELLRRWAKAMMDYGEASDYTKEDRGFNAENIYNGTATMEYEHFNVYYEIVRSQFRVAGEGETPWLQALPGVTGEKVSHISNCLAINAGGKNQLNAWRIIKLMLSDFSQGSVYGADTLDGYPILKTAYTDSSSCIQTDIKAEWARMGEEDGTVYRALSDEQYSALIDELMSPGKVLLPDSGPVKALFREAMLPYFDGEQDLDAAITALKDKLGIYVSE